MGGPADHVSFRNPDGDLRGPWILTDLTGPGSLPGLEYVWNGYHPSVGRHWRYSASRLDEMQGEGVVVYPRAGLPRMKRFLAAVAEQVRQPQEQRLGIVFSIVTASMRALAGALAARPEELAAVEWRDLERVLAVVFQGLGFRTALTRGSQDGGFDIELRFENRVFLVEVKHWKAPARVGRGTAEGFAEVIVRESANRGLILSSSGFTKELIRGRCELQRQVIALGDGRKIVGLCQLYVASERGLWDPTTGLPEILFSDTV